MTDDDQTRIINTIARIMADHVGQGEAITRKQLFRCLIGRGFDTTDREMRAMIKTHLPGVCYGSRGYYLPKDKSDADKTLEQNNKRAVALFEANKNLRKAYPEWYGSGVQGRLFN